MSPADIAAACFAGIAIVALCYFVTMAGYFFLKRSKPHWRWLPEILSVLLAFVVCTCIRVIVAFATDGGGTPENGEDSAGRFIHAIYQAISIFSFEGLNTDYIEKEASVLSAVYYGASLYTGLVALSIITTRVNYEIYSRVAFATTLLRRLTGRCDMYVFTDVTEDSLTLARSIVKEYDSRRAAVRAARRAVFGGEKAEKVRDENAIRHNTRCIIVFAGSRLTPFDHKNELFRELMRNGYYYISWYKRRRKRNAGRAAKGEKPLAQRLHFYRNNVIDCTDKHIFPRIHIISLGITADTSGAESVNSHAIFADIEALTDCAFAHSARKIEAIRKKSRSEGSPDASGTSACEVYGDLLTAECRPAWVVDYHILTDTRINYEFYQRVLDDKFVSHADDVWELNLPKLRYISEELHKQACLKFGDDSSSDISKIIRAAMENAEHDKEGRVLTGWTPSDRKVVGAIVKKMIPLPAAAPKEIQAEWEKKVNDMTAELCAAVSDKCAEVTKTLCKKKTFMRSVQMHVFNEAYLTAVDLAVKRREFFEETEKKKSTDPQIGGNWKGWENSLFRRDIDVFAGDGNSSDRGDYKAYILGFGLTGQEAMKMLYTQTAYLEVDEMNEKLPSSAGECVAVTDDGKTAPPAEKIATDNTMQTADAEGNSLSEPKEKEDFPKAGVTSALKKMGKIVSSQFIADVYDRDAENIGGLFAYQHPLFFCLKGDENDLRVSASGVDVGGKPTAGTEKWELTEHELIYAACNSLPSEGNATKDDINKEMGFPVVFFHEASCGGLDFVRKMNARIGKDGGEPVSVRKTGTNAGNDVGGKESRRAKAFVICLGDDETNINMANAIIDDARREIINPALVRKKQCREGLQIIYVHVRDGKNEARLNWTAKDAYEFAERGKDLVVIPFGRTDSVYTYDMIVDKGDAAKFNYIYNSFSVYPDKEKKTDELMWDIISGIQEGKDISPATFKQLEETMKGVSGINERKLLQDWLDVTPYKKESNLSVKLFSCVYEKKIGDLIGKYAASAGKEEGSEAAEAVRELYAQMYILSLIEKMRWSRFSVAHGWVFGEPRDESCRVHTGILPPTCIYERAKDARTKGADSKYNEFKNYPLYDFGNILGVYKKLKSIADEESDAGGGTATPPVPSEG